MRELLTGFTIYNGFTMACILQLLFTAIATNFKSVTIRIRFLSTISSSLFSSITPSKSLDIPQHYPRYKFIEFTITSQDIFIFFIYSKFWFCYFQYYLKKGSIKASKVILIYFSPNCKVFTILQNFFFL